MTLKFFLLNRWNFTLIWIDYKVYSCQSLSRKIFFDKWVINVNNLEMKKSFLAIVNKVALPLCCIVICIAIFINDVDLLPYHFLIRFVVLIGSVMVVVANVMNLSSKGFWVNIKDITMEKRFYLNYYNVIETLFSWYFFLYTLLKLYMESIMFTYAMILALGIYCGCRMIKCE